MLIKHNQIVNQSITKSLISLTLPAIGSSLFIVVFEIVDMFWVGKLGSVPVAALSAASFLVWMLRSLAETVAIGAIAMVSRRTGEGDRKKLLDTTINSLISALIFSIIILILISPLLKQLYQWIRVSNEVASLAVNYVYIFLIGLVFIYLMVTGEHIIRGMGNTKIPMMITGFSLLLNCILDPIFIFYFQMGLKGAAYATVLSQIIGCFLMMGAVIHFFPDLKKRTIHIGKQFFRKYFFPLIKIGMPISLSGVAFAFIYLILSGIISHFGNQPLAAIGIGHRLESLPFFLALGFSMAVSTMVGQNLGAGQPEKAKDSVYLSIKVGSILLFIISLIFLIIPNTLYKFFISDPEVIRHGIHYLRIMAIFQVSLAFEVILQGGFSGAGDTKPPFLIILPITFLRIPFSYFFGIVLGLGINAVWWVISITTLMKGTFLFLWFRKGDWMKKRV